MRCARRRGTGRLDIVVSGNERDSVFWINAAQIEFDPYLVMKALFRQVRVVQRRIIYNTLYV